MGKRALSLQQQIIYSGLPHPTPEYRFAPPRRWRFDLAWVGRKLAVEIEGAVWRQGRHTRGSGFVADMEKYNAAALQGWLLLRVTPQQVASGEALQLVTRAVEATEVRVGPVIA